MASSLCSGNSNKAGRTSELLEKANSDSGLSSADQNELSILQVTTIQLEADRNSAIHNALMSDDSQEAKQLAINSLAQVVGTSTVGIAAVIGKIKPGTQPGNRIEQTLSPEKNWESARNKALDIFGSLGTDSKPVIGRLEVSAGNGKDAVTVKLAGVLIMIQTKALILTYGIILKVRGQEKRLSRSYPLRVTKKLLKRF